MKTVTLENFELRGDGAGGFKGASVTYLEQYFDEANALIFSKITNPQPVPLGADRTLLESVIGIGVSTAISANERLTADLKTATDELVKAKADSDAALAKVKSESDALTARVAELQEKLDAMQPPVDVNGVPQVVTMVQAQLALLAAGLLDAIESAIASIPGVEGKAAKIQWANAVEVHRNNPLVLGMQAALKMTDAQIDDLFIDAAKR